jgi:hypothetical protein
MPKPHISETMANGTAPACRSDLLRDYIQRLLADNPEYVIAGNDGDSQLEAVHLIDDQSYYHTAYRISSTTVCSEKLGLLSPKTTSDLSWDESSFFIRGKAKSRGTAKVASRHYYTGLMSRRIDIIEESPSGYEHRLLYDSDPGFPIEEPISAEAAIRLGNDLDELEEYDLIKPLGLSPEFRLKARQIIN